MLPGDAAPWLKVRSIQNERFHFDTSVKALWDLDREVARLYCIADGQGAYGVAPTLFLADPSLRVIAIRPLREAADAAALAALIPRLPQVAPAAPAVTQAPVRMVNHVFETAVCRALVEYYDRQGTIVPAT